jgi:hypothetical protein
MRFAMLCLLAIGLMLPQAVRALDRPSDSSHLGIGTNVGWYMLTGDDLEGTHDGLGIEAYTGVGIRRTLGFDLNVGFHFSRHDLDLRTYYINLYGVYLEPRFLYGGNARTILPFAGARFGWVRRVAQNRNRDSSLDSNGYALGGIAGVVVPIPGPFRLEVAFTVTHVSFEPIFGGGSDGKDTGTSKGLQLGITFPIIAPSE